MSDEQEQEGEVIDRYTTSLGEVTVRMVKNPNYAAPPISHPLMIKPKVVSRPVPKSWQEYSGYPEDTECCPACSYKKSIIDTFIYCGICCTSWTPTPRFR